MRRLQVPISPAVSSRLPAVRGGWQLVELMFTIGITAMVLAVAGRYLAVLMNAESRYGLALQETAVLSRLAEQFRDDAHESSGATPLEQGIEFNFADGRTARYRAEQSMIHREVSNAGARPLSRDVFRLSAGAYRFEHRSAEDLVALVREQAPLQSGFAPQSRPDIRIEAVVGLLAGANSMGAAEVAEAARP